MTANCLPDPYGCAECGISAGRHALQNTPGGGPLHQHVAPAAPVILARMRARRTRKAHR